MVFFLRSEQEYIFVLRDGVRERDSYNNMSNTKQIKCVIPGSCETLLTLLETLPDAFFIVDDTETIVYANASAQAMLGATREELVGKPLWCGAPQLVSPPLYQTVQKAKQTRALTEVAYASPTTNGWLHVSLSPTDEGLAILFHEQREPLHLQDASRWNEHMYRDLLESFSDGVTILTPDGLILDINQRPLADAHLRREGAIGKPFTDLPAWSHDPAVQQHLRAAIARAARGETVRFEARIYPRTDLSLDILMTITSHRDASQQVEYLICAGRDITERKQAEEALRENHVRFRRLVDSNLIGITVAGCGGTIYEANEAFLTLVGYTQEDVASGQVNWRVMTPPEYQAQTDRVAEELRTTGMFQPYEKEYVTKTGERVPVLLGGTVFCREGSMPLHISFILDLTARKEMERQKDLFVGMTSHELKTPLAALRGTLQLVQRRLKRVVTTVDHVSPEIHTFFDRLTKNLEDSVRQVDVQTRLINDLLDISRITANTLMLELEHGDLITIVREIVEDIRVIVPERVLLLELPEHTVVNVLADRDRISQVITNYITNAIRYASPDQPIHIGLAVQQDLARVWVRDTGPGLSEEAQKDIWLRYHQVKGAHVQSGSGKGLGLGLYICRAVIEQQNGVCGVESTLGKGATFWFTLPIVT